MRLARGLRPLRETAGLLGALRKRCFAESILPFDEVCRSFVGDRYGELGETFPAGADYVCQATPEMRFDR